MQCHEEIARGKNQIEVAFCIGQIKKIAVGEECLGPYLRLNLKTFQRLVASIGVADPQELQGSGNLYVEQAAVKAMSFKFLSKALPERHRLGNPSPLGVEAADAVSEESLVVVVHKGLYQNLQNISKKMDAQNHILWNPALLV